MKQPQSPQKNSHGFGAMCKLLCDIMFIFTYSVPEQHPTYETCIILQDASISKLQSQISAHLFLSLLLALVFVVSFPSLSPSLRSPYPLLSLIDFLKVLWKDGLLILSTLSCPKGITDDQRLQISVILSKAPCSVTIQELNQEIKNAVFPSLLVYVRASFRMRQVNVVGSSPFSQPSSVMQTLQASPDVAPADLSVLSSTETSLRIRWQVRMGHKHS